MIFKGMMVKKGAILFLGLSLLLGGCEDVDLLRATDAGADAVQAITLSDAAVRDLASQAARIADGDNRVAPPESSHALRLAKIIAGHLEQDGYLNLLRIFVKISATGLRVRNPHAHDG